MFSDFLNDDDDDEEIVFETKPNARSFQSNHLDDALVSSFARLLERVTKGEKLTLSSCEEPETIDNIETHVVRYQQKRWKCIIIAAVEKFRSLCTENPQK